jgi:hypothetical protein
MRSGARSGGWPAWGERALDGGIQQVRGRADRRGWTPLYDWAN